MAVMTGAELANTLDTEVNLTRDYIAQRTSAVVPVNKGGTGATTAATARTNLGAAGSTDMTTALAGKAPTSHQHQSIDSGGNHLAYEGGGVFGTDQAFRVGSNLTVGNHAYVPNAVAATSGYVVAYINSDGRLSKGASSRRFKKNISEREPLALGSLFAAPFCRWQMKADGITPADPAWHYGYIAEDLQGTPMEPFLVYEWADGKPTDQPLSIDFIGLLLAQNAQLNERVSTLEARLAALEARA
jgi:hypothetical protein